MECRYLFNKVKYSEELIAYTENKLLKQLAKYTNKNIEAVISFKSQGVMSISHCHYYGGNGFNIIVQGKSRNLFESVDFMLHKLQVQLKRRKEKIKDHHLKDKKLSQARLSLISATKQVFVNGLNILGVSAPESM